MTGALAVHQGVEAPAQSTARVAVTYVEPTVRDTPEKTDPPDLAFDGTT